LNEHLINKTLEDIQPRVFEGLGRWYLRETGAWLEEHSTDIREDDLHQVPQTSSPTSIGSLNFDSLFD